MSLQDIRRYMIYLRAIRKAVNRGDIETADRWLKELKAAAIEVMSIGRTETDTPHKPAYMPYTWKVSRSLARTVDKVHALQREDPDQCIQIVESWIRYLKGIKNQAPRYNGLYKEIIWPLFKEAGFKKRGSSRFYLPPQGDRERQAHVQKSYLNNYESISFTFNLGKGKEVEYTPDSRRIHGLPGVKGGPWYEITPHTRLAQLGNLLQHDLAIAIEYLKSLPEG